MDGSGTGNVSEIEDAANAQSRLWESNRTRTWGWGGVIDEADGAACAFSAGTPASARLLCGLLAPAETGSRGCPGTSPHERLL